MLPLAADDRGAVAHAQHAAAEHAAGCQYTSPARRGVGCMGRQRAVRGRRANSRRSSCAPDHHNLVLVEQVEHASRRCRDFFTIKDLEQLVLSRRAGYHYPRRTSGGHRASAPFLTRRRSTIGKFAAVVDDTISRTMLAFGTCGHCLMPRAAMRPSQCHASLPHCATSHCGR